MSEEQPSRRSFTESAKDALSMAAEKAREMVQYASGAALNGGESVKEMATGDKLITDEDKPVVEDKKLSQPWSIAAPSSLPGPIEGDGLKYGCKPAAPEEVSKAHLHGLAHPTSSLKTF